MTEDEMVGWHRQLNGHEFEQAPGVDDGQGGLECCSPWGLKELDMSEQLDNNNRRIIRECKSSFSLTSVTECFYTNDKVSTCLRELCLKLLMQRKVIVTTLMGEERLKLIIYQLLQ